MSVLPDSLIRQIEFCEAHAPVWAAAPTTIGLTAAQVTALQQATTAARTAYDNAQKARQSSRGATELQNTVARTLRSSAADLIRQIKAFAELQAVPGSVYAAAQIPQPLPPSPLPAPGKPTAINSTLEPSGAVTLSWEAENAAASSGAFFQILRKLPGQTGFVGIGGAPGSTSESRRMTFTDSTVPTAAAGVGAQYIIQGTRGTVQGAPSDAVVAQFGVDSGGGGGGGGFSSSAAGASGSGAGNGISLAA